MDNKIIFETFLLFDSCMQFSKKTFPVTLEFEEIEKNIKDSKILGKIEFFKKLVALLKIEDPSNKKKNQTGFFQVVKQSEAESEKIECCIFFSQELDEIETIKMLYMKLKNLEIEKAKKAAAYLDDFNAEEKLSFNDHSIKQKELKEIIDSSQILSEKNGLKTFSDFEIDEAGGSRVLTSNHLAKAKILLQPHFLKNESSYRADVLGEFEKKNYFKIYDSQGNEAKIFIEDPLKGKKNSTLLFLAYKIPISVNLKIPQNQLNISGFGVKAVKICVTEINFPFSEEEAGDFFKAFLGESEPTQMEIQPELLTD